LRQYSRVSYAVRCQIYAFLEINLSIPEIADRLGFNKSTIYRELKRNTLGEDVYLAEFAQVRAEKRYLRCRRKKLLKGALLKLVKSKLQKDWTPQQIRERCKVEKVSCVSHETIYKFVRRRENHHYFRFFNRRGYTRYSRLKMRRDSHLSIQQRPKIVEQRKRFGDWERDSMIVAKDKILVCTERKSRFTKIEPYKEFNAAMISKMTLELITPLGRPVKTITNDNGPEFRGEQDHGVPVYYCDPRRPQQRGTVENTIGILRKRLGRKTMISKIGKNGLKEIEKGLNLRPRRCLGFRTPYEVFYNTKVALVS
jgi:transposase, IS30 family